MYSELNIELARLRIAELLRESECRRSRARRR